jgi:hypothetical protein
MDGCDDSIEIRFRSNVARINRLVTFIVNAEPLQQELPLQNSEGVRADILRAVVVYLFATFEDILRSIARQHLSTAAPTGFKDIPFVGGREQKLTLSQLAEHRAKSVAQLIDESVQSYLDTKTFSSFQDVVHILARIGLDAKPFGYLSKPLGQLMRRRHQIVHEADLPSPQDNAVKAWTVADDWQLWMWLLSVEAFYFLVRAGLDPSNPKWQASYDRLATIIDEVVSVGNRLVDLGSADATARAEARQKVFQSMDSVLVSLKKPKAVTVSPIIP